MDTLKKNQKAKARALKNAYTQLFPYKGDEEIVKILKKLQMKFLKEQAAYEAMRNYNNNTIISVEQMILEAKHK